MENCRILSYSLRNRKAGTIHNTLILMSNHPCEIYKRNILSRKLILHSWNQVLLHHKQKVIVTVTVQQCVEMYLTFVGVICCKSSNNLSAGGIFVNPRGIEVNRQGIVICINNLKKSKVNNKFRTNKTSWKYNIWCNTYKTVHFEVETVHFLRITKSSIVLSEDDFVINLQFLSYIESYIVFSSLFSISAEPICSSGGCHGVNVYLGLFDIR